MATLICVSIMVRGGTSEDLSGSIDAALEDAVAARQGGADLVEYRVDEFFSGDFAASEGVGDGPGTRDSQEVSEILRLVEHSPLSAIVTCRSASEGGAYDGDEMARVALYERLGTAFGTRPDGSSEHPPKYLDLEFSAYERSANIRQKVMLAVEHPEQVRDVRTSLILSMHDFNGRPPDFTRRLARMREVEAARVLKFAIRARSLRDNLELFDVLIDRDRPTIALAMGEFGLMSRVLAPKFGGFLTFASLRDAVATAPGQPTLQELVETYRFRSIGPRTKVFGVVGWPVGHSLSPLVHNAGFREVGFDGVYVPLPVAAGDREKNSPGREGVSTGSAPNARGDADSGGYESLKATLLELIAHSRLDFSGASVTLPHKELLVRLAREQAWELDEWSKWLGAANTLAIDRDADGTVRTVRIANTDAPASADCLEAQTGPLANRLVVLVGAGGVARAVAGGVMARGARVLVVNRTRARAEAMVASLSASRPRSGSLATAAQGDVRAGDWTDLDPREVVAVVNATPIGMSGGPSPSDSAVPPDVLRRLGQSPRCVVFDTVYTPAQTPTLRAASEVGLRTLDGVGMFVRQAAMQFAMWTGREAPAALYERLARARLATPASEA